MNLKKIAAARRTNEMTPELEWLDKLPLALSFVFHNNTRLTCIHAGVLPRHSWKDLENNIEICFVRNVSSNGEMIEYKPQNSIKGIPWHKFYNGRFGLIASGHASSSDNPTFYDYSCNLDGKVFETGQLNCQIFSENGKEELVQVSGKAFSPQLQTTAKKKEIYIPQAIKNGLDRI